MRWRATAWTRSRSRRSCASKPTEGAAPVRPGDARPRPLDRHGLRGQSLHAGPTHTQVDDPRRRRRRARRAAGRDDAAAGAARHAASSFAGSTCRARSRSRSMPSRSATRAWRRPSRPAAIPAGPKVKTVEHLLSACSGPRPRQPDRRHHRRGGADPRRLGRLVRVPAAERRHRPAGRAEAVPARQEDGRGARRRGRVAEVGAARAVRGLQAHLRDRVRPPGGRTRPASASSSTWARASYKREIARARTFGFTKERRDDALARPRPAAAAWTT